MVYLKKRKGDRQKKILSEKNMKVKILMLLLSLCCLFPSFTSQDNIKSQQIEATKLCKKNLIAEAKSNVTNQATLKLLKEEKPIALSELASEKKSSEEIISCEGGISYVEKEVIKEKKKEKKTKKESKKKKKINKQDLYALSHLIYAEGGSEEYSDKLRYYIGSVVLNRVKSKYYKDTIEGVIFEEGQYACTWLGTYYNKPTKKCIKIAKELLQEGSVLPDKVIYQAEFKQGNEVYAHFDNTYFCCE